MNRTKTCDACGSRVIGAFCTDCGAATHSSKKRKRLVLDIGERELSLLKRLALAEGATVREYVLDAIQKKREFLHEENYADNNTETSASEYSDFHCRAIGD